MWSSNLVKQVFTTAQTDEKRVIDTNELVQRRLEKLEERKSVRTSGFMPGLEAQELELPAEDGEGENGSNVVKYQENPEKIIENARQEAENILATARAEALRIREDACAQAEQEKMRILADARQQGYNEGNSRAQAEAQQVKQEYAEKGRVLEDVFRQQLNEMEPQLVDVITDIYQHIFHVELQSYREILMHLIASTLRKSEDGHNFLIHVSKEDYPYVSMQKKLILAGIVSANCNVDIVEDMTLAKNECLIEADGGVFDCGLGTQLAELKQKLTLLSWSKEE